VLFVDGLNHNLLNVPQMCDQGYDVLFKAKKCQIKYAGRREIVVEAIKIDSNVYVLKRRQKGVVFQS